MRTIKSEVVGKRKRKRDCDGGAVRFAKISEVNGSCGYKNSFVVFLVTFLALALRIESASAAAWLSPTYSNPSVSSSLCPNSRLPRCHGTHRQRLYSVPRSEKTPEREKSVNNDDCKADSKIVIRDLEFDEASSKNDDLDSLRAQAAKLRNEAESLQSALQESKEAKIQREIDKVDGWIDDLLIEVTLGDGTELLKTVDQVYEVLMEKRYSALHVLKIFDRLCDVRAQESRSNCSPLMELLVDATGKLDCTEREENPNKRWNHRVERVLRKKLFARDWNIEYVSEDEKFW